MPSLLENLQGKKVAVAFSSGFFGFFHHAGVLKALHENGVRPVSVSGTSAGAIVAGLYGAGLEPEQICNALLTVKRQDFWDFQFPFTSTGFGWLKGGRFGALLSKLLPVHDFASCKVPVTVGVYGVEDGRSRHLSTGSLIQGIRASCAVPYLFSPVRIDGRTYWDGGFQEKTPLGHMVNDKEIEAVLISHMPPREERNGKKKDGLLSGVAFLADTPLEERQERDQASVRLLRESGKEVFVMAPQRVWLGPFSLDKAKEAMEFGYTEALRLLNSTDLKESLDFP